MEEGSELPHKAPFRRCSQEGLSTAIPASVSFNLEKLLQDGVLKCLAAYPSPSSGLPPPSPTLEPLTDISEDLFSLSPLTSPCTSAESSPRSSILELPPGDCLASSPLVAEPGTAPLAAPTDANPMSPVNVEEPEVALPSLDHEACHRAKKHQNRRRSKNHENRQQKREQAHAEAFCHHTTRPNVQKKHVESAEQIETKMATELGSAAKTAFVGRNDKSGRKISYKLEDLVGEKSTYKFGYVAWDGGNRKHVTDAKGRRVAFLAGRPSDKDWPTLMLDAAEALDTRRERLDIPKEDRTHRRGAFPAVPCGISHGGGSTAPSNLSNNAANSKVVEELSHMKCFQRLAGFATSIMASQAPKLYHYYVEHLAKLHARLPHLKRLFPSSVFTAASYNFGPRTVCFKHKDFANLPFGLCAVTALGSFDPTRGGHLVLWECRLVIEFPPGSTILLPSAIIAHSNTPIQRGETRYSFAQYTAGGIFRWVEHDYKLEDEFYRSLSEERLEQERAKDEGRWEFGLSLFETTAHA